MRGKFGPTLRWNWDFEGDSAVESAAEPSISLSQESSPRSKYINVPLSITWRPGQVKNDSGLSQNDPFWSDPDAVGLLSHIEQRSNTDPQARPSNIAIACQESNSQTLASAPPDPFNNPYLVEELRS
jgi:hypothetical protein